MKKILVIILTLYGLFINAQEKVKIKGLTKKEIKAIKKQLQKKDQNFYTYQIKQVEG